MLKGAIVALATPFTREEEVDYPCLAELIEWHIAEGTDGIVLAGATGEALALTDEERLTIFKEGVRVARGRIPIIAGTGSCNTKETVRITEEAKRIGVDAAMVITPYFNRPGPQGCFSHFEAVDRVGLPLIVYYHPGRTSLKLPVSTLVKIGELSSVVAIKEGSGDLDYTIELIQQTGTKIFAGDDTLTIPIMACGGVGVISVVTNLIPREWKRMTALLLEGNVREAREIFRKYYSLCKGMTLETNPQCVKYALSLMGKCRPHLRLPLMLPQAAVQEQIARVVAEVRLVEQQVAACEVK